jgi:hypothetical protein
VPFPYIATYQVEVRKNTVLLVAASDYTWPTSSTIQLTSNAVNGDVLEVRRNSMKKADGTLDRLVDWTTRPRSTSRTSTRQTCSASTSRRKPSTLRPTRMQLVSDNTYDALTRRIKNVGNAVQAQDAVTKAQLDAAALAPVTPTAGSIANIPSGNLASANVQAALNELQSDVDTRALTASPVLTGDPQAPTPANGDDDTSIATSAFVNNHAGRTVRQTALFGNVDSSGYANFLTTGSGLRPGLLATATALALGFSNGMKEEYEEFSADVADILSADLPASNTSYVYRTKGSSWGSTLVPPQYGYAFDRAQNSLLHFEQAAGAPLCDFGNTYLLNGGATLTTTKPPYGTRCLDLSGGATSAANTKCAYTTDITTLGPDSWEMSVVFWHDVAPAATPVAHYVGAATNTSQFGVEFGWLNNGGTNRFVLNVSSDGTSRNVANLAVGTLTPTTGHWYRYRCQFDALGGKYRLFISDGGTGATPVWAVEVKDIEVASTARVCACARVVWGATLGGTGIANGASGFLDEARIVRGATSTSVGTPSGFPKSVTDFPVHFFSIPEMKMYEVTSASATAGVNPVMTRRSRLFIGECDTSGAAITAARTYALRGRYVSAPITGVAVSTAFSFQHNIGVGREHLECELLAKNGNPAGGIGSGPFQWASAVSYDNTNAITYPAEIGTAGADSKNNWRGQSGPNGIMFAQTGNQTTGISLRLIARRTF